ncbi:hypothetical protein LCGC14_0482860 [marine sediment metagenome]|uniref:Uncharacterized protein n=1 Tax=marine sediment metagenome TaxID=412755 RepID=A0A0F9VHQ6_9ZZZZ|nr:hypothetical protein [bacterium]
MVVTIAWPDNTAGVTDAIRDAIGRDVTINTTVSGIPCPVSGCLLNPVTNLATDPFCLVCEGQHWINTTSGLVVNAHVTWRPADIPVWVTGGVILQGDCLIQIKYTDLRLDQVNEATNFIVDSKEMIKHDVILRGVPDLNRILVTLKEVD